MILFMVNLIDYTMTKGELHISNDEVKAFEKKGSLITSVIKKDEKR